MKTKKFQAPHSDRTQNQRSHLISIDFYKLFLSLTTYVTTSRFFIKTTKNPFRFVVFQNMRARRLKLDLRKTANPKFSCDHTKRQTAYGENKRVALRECGLLLWVLSVLLYKYLYGLLCYSMASQYDIEYILLVFRIMIQVFLVLIDRKISSNKQ